MFTFIFFKQKTAYELRISDWSSDVCSSDLDLAGLQAAALNLQTRLADTAEERFRLESQALDISIAEQKRRIEANADYTDAQKATLLAALGVKASYERDRKSAGRERVGQDV